MSFNVLVVCTGNIHRSPMTALLLQARSDPGAALEVHTAGTHAVVGYPMDDGAAVAMKELGLDPSRHRARQFEPAMAAEADLILTAEREHLDYVLSRIPTALRRTFTIKEFARIAPHLRRGSSPRDAVVQAAAYRGLVKRPANPADDDVADPHRQPIDVQRATAAELAAAVKPILDGLGLARTDQPSHARRRPRPGPGKPKPTSGE